jgi:hypothetical protein
MRCIYQRETGSPRELIGYFLCFQQINYMCHHVIIHALEYWTRVVKSLICAPNEVGITERLIIPEKAAKLQSSESPSYLHRNRAHTSSTCQL